VLTLQIVLSGILLGGLYACLAIGFSIIWGVTNLINLAHGSMAILGAYVTWLLWSHAGVDPFLSVPFTAAALFAFGYALQWTVLNRITRTSLFMTLIFTFGLDMLLINVMLALFSADIRGIPLPYSGSALTLGEIRLPYTRLAVFAVALALALALHLFLDHTRSGQAVRAAAQNPRAAAMLGIDSNHINALAFGIGAALAGAAGALIAVVYSFSPVTGSPLTMKAFVIVALGGLGSMRGVIAAGIALGVAENIVSGLLVPGYRDAVSFVLLVLILIFRPRGLFGDRYLFDARMR
jgi:branched-chain amino acid transport system permease protein